MIKKLLNSSILTSWFNTGVIIFSSLVAIPIVLTKLSVEEINVWFLIGVLVAISQGVVNGFTTTFMRFISYSYSGVKLSHFRNIKNKSISDFDSEFNICELKKILDVMKVIYIVLSIFFILVLSLVGYFALNKPITEIVSNSENAWTAWYIVLIISTVNLYLGYYNVFLIGINKIALIQKISGLINLTGLGFILVVLFFYPSLISIVAVYQFVAISIAITLFFVARRHIRNLNLPSSKLKFHRDVFLLVWESAWKSTITTISANVINHISGILVANFFSASQSASFLFTKRIFDIIERFTQTTFQARLPIIARLRGRGELKKLIPYLKQTQYICFFVFIIGYLSLVLFGQPLLSFISVKVNLGSINLIILFSFSIFLRRWTGISMGISNQANYILDYLTVPISGVVFFAIIVLFQTNFGVNVYPLAQIMAILTITPIIIIKYYPILQTTFFKYERKVSLVGLILLSLINFVIYMLS